MNESGFDTLKATRALEAAGFQSGQAEAMVTVFGGAIVGNVATKWDVHGLKSDVAVLQTDVSELKGDVATLKSDVATLKGDVATLKSDVAEMKGDIVTLQGGFATLRTEFDAKLKQEIGTLRTELKSEIAEVRVKVESFRATMYRLLLAQAAVIVSLVVGLQRLLQ